MEPESRGDEVRGQKQKLVEALIEAARVPDAAGWDKERKERIYEKIMIRVERREQRIRMARAFAAGASAVLVGGLLLRLVGVDVAWPTRSRGEVAERGTSERMIR